MARCLKVWGGIGLLFFAARMPATAQTYVSLFLGNSRTLDSDARLIAPGAQTDITFRKARWRLTNRSAPYFGLRIGGYLRHAPHWGAELNYTHSKAVLNVQDVVFATGTLNGQAVNGPARIGDIIQRQEFLNGVNSLSLHLLYRARGRSAPSFPHGRLQFYAGAGPAFAWVSNSNRVLNQTLGKRFETIGFGPSALLGADYGLFRKVRLYLEGRYTRHFARVKTAGNGTFESPLDTWHVSLGIKYEL